jgi:lysozyme
MAYNMGVKGLLKFTDMLTALYEHRYDDAAAAALDSVWARQVGDRATRIANLIRSAE